MTPLTVSTLYVLVLFPMFCMLFMRVSLLRGKTNISIGDGGNVTLATRIRRHGNFVETVPYALILLVVAELNGVAPLVLHTSGIILVAARILHAIGLRADRIIALRIAGGSGTLLAMAIAVVATVIQRT